MSNRFFFLPIFNVSFSFYSFLICDFTYIINIFFSSNQQANKSLANARASASGTVDEQMKGNRLQNLT
jgi:hypothetical protein